MHHVIAEYLSVSMTCVFAVENYKQETWTDANRKLRDQFNVCMGMYEKIYDGRGDWPLSIEDLVDHRTVAHLHYLAEQQADIFIKEFKDLISSAGADRFDIHGAWTRLLQDQPINSAILSLVKELREWEEENIWEEEYI